LFGKDQGHYASILVALGNDNSAVADEWLAIAKQFHGLAHRHEPWLKPRQASIVAALWSRYEKILAILTGSVYAIQDRIGQLIKVQEPTPEMLGALPNLIKGR